MSRALDKDTVRALGRGDSSSAYEAISKAVTQTPSEDENEEDLLEIEILGRSHPLEPGTFLVQDGNALGISKLGLVQAFFTARTMLQGHHSSQETTLAAEQLLSVTSVMLLMDPEHLTAANVRKKLIQAEGLRNGEARQLAMIRKDRFYIDSLLTSRLHRHTKSPTLWSHRRWLVETARGRGSPPEVVRDLKRIVMIAGERHPKNYYAWCHARWLTDLSLALSPQHPAENGSLLSTLVAATKSWCFRNHTDISGWSYLSFLLTRLNDTERVSVFKEAVNLCASFRWVNESTWVFLRTLAASGSMGNDEMALFHDTMSSLLRRCEGTESRRVVEQAQFWSETYHRRP
ncbi:protein prenylyltransferase [Cryphonectria parasitica EP155]|uniref:Protein prenylyltransferase n=1 Tax=Cryphonectria parasitica (strain ATCC 38755 / EP155) TaxID=660469 RepID=A0A9P4Y3G6_CRYP1|nr:protein prenylyltransferase [Cryphonectria parasitica EP155]KAF3765833.1 protein prenylyltransferase [Cryphonectria parasitica EP155]